jgi:uracil phosphoribosyltransferase
MDRVLVSDHPLVQHKLSTLRDVNTSVKDFRELSAELSMLLAFEAMRDLQLEETEIMTPVAPARVNVLAGKKLALVGILRAGLVMVDGLLTLVPNARVGHIGLYRDEQTLQPVEYFRKLPSDISERDAFLLDPMLATGGSASAAISILKEAGARSVKLLCIIGAPEGIAKVRELHQDVDIILAGLDSHLNGQGYIVPGLGDAGDRIYGTR